MSYLNTEKNHLFFFHSTGLLLLFLPFFHDISILLFLMIRFLHVLTRAQDLGVFDGHELTLVPKVSKGEACCI